MRSLSSVRLGGRDSLCCQAATERLGRGGGWRMDKFVVQENVKRFRKQLQDSSDEHQLDTLKDLLAEAKDQLAELEHRPLPNAGRYRA